MKLLSSTLWVAIVCIASAIAHSAAIADDRALTILSDTDLPGGDYQTNKHVTLDQCKQACLGDATCAGFTFNSKAKWCFLKSAPGAASPYKGAISGTIVASGAEATAGGQPMDVSSTDPSLSSAFSPDQIKLAKRYQAAIVYCATDKQFHLRDSGYKGPALFADPWACQDGVVVGCQTFTQDPFVCLGWAPILLPDDAAIVASIMKAEGLKMPDGSPQPAAPEENPAYDATADLPGTHDIECPGPLASNIATMSISLPDNSPELQDRTRAQDFIQRFVSAAFAQCGMRGVNQVVKFNINDGCVRGEYDGDMIFFGDKVAAKLYLDRNCFADAADSAKREAVQETAASAKKAKADELNREFAVFGTTPTTLAVVFANPFVLQGKKVGLTATFTRMLTPTEAIFSSSDGKAQFDVVGLPSADLFTQPVPAAIAVTVEGTRVVEGIGTVPYGDFIGSVACPDGDCSWFE